MRRNWDIVRDILLEIELREEPVWKLELPYPDEAIRYHTALLIEAGLLNGRVERDSEGKIHLTLITGMPWAGHEFIDTIRSKDLWKKTMSKVRTIGGSVSLTILQKIAEKLMSGMI